MDEDNFFNCRANVPGILKNAAEWMCIWFSNAGCVFFFFFMSFLHIEIGELLYSWFSLNLVLRKGRMWSFVTIYLHITALY